MNNKQQKWLVIALVVAALNAGIWFFGIAPSRTAIDDVERQISAAEQKKTQLIQRLTVLNEIDVEALELEQGEQLILIPDAGLLREMMTELEAVALQMENEVLSINFAAPASDDVIQSMGITLSLTGEYDNIYSYIKYLETHPRIILINSFSLGASEEDLSATIQLAIFAHDFDPYTPYEAPGRDSPFRAE